MAELKDNFFDMSGLLMNDWAYKKKIKLAGVLGIKI